MLRVAGFQEHFTSIEPGFNFNLDLSTLLSFSVYSNHAVWVTKDGLGHGVGDNRGLSIIGSLPEKEYVESTTFQFYDDEKNPCKLLSACCGACYTLYHVQPLTPGSNTRLAYVEWNKNNGTPLFLNLLGRNPQNLFGGRESAAAVDTEGKIIFISELAFENNKQPPPILSLPNNEKATCVACCQKFIVALSSTGHVYKCALSNEKIESSFELSKELADIKCVQVSGTWNHCYAVAEDGRIFACGINFCFQINYQNENLAVKDFTQVEALKKYKIKIAFAGYTHSLFITDEGKLLSCGRNSFGQLLLETGPNKNITPTPSETVITSGATFAMAGPGISAVFIGGAPPPNTPNLPIVRNFQPAEENESGLPEARKFADKDAEISFLRRELEGARSGNEELRAEIANLRKELEEARKNERLMQQKIEELEKNGK